MLESQKFISLQRILTKDSNIRSVIKNASSVASKYPGLGTQTFTSAADLRLLAEQLNKLKIPQINQILIELKVPHSIVAFPIHRTPKYTLFFVIVPPQKRFDWHTHPKMGGISKCFHGHLEISTIDIYELQRISLSSFLYSKNKMRFQSLKCSDPQTVSVIEPNTYNIHRIEAVQLSAFFDLLMPDYPDNTCQFFKTIDENNEALMLEQTESDQEQIIGWDVYHEQLLNREKSLTKNVILK